jgi:hypothetical protein
VTAATRLVRRVVDEEMTRAANEGRVERMPAISRKLYAYDNARDVVLERVADRVGDTALATRVACAGRSYAFGMDLAASRSTTARRCEVGDPALHTVAYRAGKFVPVG